MCPVRNVTYVSGCSSGSRLKIKEFDVSVWPLLTGRCKVVASFEFLA
jgi:hypothetical protein